jgi:hypothetical protein
LFGPPNLCRLRKLESAGQLGRPGVEIDRVGLIATRESGDEITDVDVELGPGHTRRGLDPDDAVDDSRLNGFAATAAVDDLDRKRIRRRGGQRGIRSVQGS